MKKVKTIFSPRKLVVWLFLLLIIITVPEFTRPSMSQTEAIVNMMCVDTEAGNFNVAASIITPAEGKKANYTIYNASGKTLGDAMDKISLSIGKEMGFSQCEVMAFGDNISEQGVISALDFMVRLKKVSRNAILMNFGGDIKDFGEAVRKLYTDKQIKIEQVINFDKRYILTEDCTIDNFYLGYFNQTTIGILPKIKVQKQEMNNAIEVQGSDQSGSAEQASSGGEQQEKLYLLNDGTMSIYKKGIKLLEMDESQVQDVNLFINKDYQGLVILEHITDDVYNDATVVINITKNKPKLKAVFENDLPVYKIDNTLTFYIEEIVQDEQKSSFMRRNKEFYTQTLLDAIKEKVKTDMTETIEFCKTNKLDLLKVFENFNCFKYGQFKKYTDKVGKENYLEQIDYQISVDLESAY